MSEPAQKILQKHKVAVGWQPFNGSVEGVPCRCVGDPGQKLWAEVCLCRRIAHSEQIDTLALLKGFQTIQSHLDQLCAPERRLGCGQGSLDRWHVAKLAEQQKGCQPRPPSARIAHGSAMYRNL